MNLQLANAGNMGDIIKHAALVYAARTIASRNPDTTVNYLETHAFQMITSLKDPDKWNSEVSKQAYEFEGYDDYIALEQPYVSSGLYLCSCGLAVECLNQKRLFLAESDDNTRHRLNRQLSIAGFEPEILLSDMHHFKADYLSAYRGPLLALVDPFYEGEEEWARTWTSAIEAVKGLHKPGSDGAVLVFQYQKESTPIWLDPPPDFNGPTATAQFKPYHMSLYCTDSLVEKMIPHFITMGWSSCG